MKVRKSNPLQAGFEFYVTVVHDAIEEIGNTADGSVLQQVNIDTIRSMIRRSPKDAQMAIQVVHELLRQPDATKSGNPQLHGTWLMIAYLMEYGLDDPSSKMLRKLAPEFYEAAILEMKKQGLGS